MHDRIEVGSYLTEIIIDNYASTALKYVYLSSLLENHGTVILALC